MPCVQHLHTWFHLACACGHKVQLPPILTHTLVRCSTFTYLAYGMAGPPDILDNTLLVLVVADHCLGPSSACALIEAAQLAPLWVHWIFAGVFAAVIWAAMHGLKAARTATLCSGRQVTAIQTLIADSAQHCSAGCSRTAQGCCMTPEHGPIWQPAWCCGSGTCVCMWVCKGWACGNNRCSMQVLLTYGGSAQDHVFMPHTFSEPPWAALSHAPASGPKRLPYEY